MRTAVIAALAASAVLAAPAAAQNISGSGVDPSSVGTVTVEIYDGATGGCWTNMEGVRARAARKLKSKGFEVVPEDGDAFFTVEVNAFRIQERFEGRRHNVCFGRVEVSLFRPTMRGGVFGAFQIARRGGLASGGRNLDASVMNSVTQVIAEF